MTDLFTPTNECLGCELVEHQPVSLRDGRVVCNTCPAWRLECEASYVAAMSTTATRAAYLADVDQKRGKAAGDELRAEVKAIWGAR